MTLDIIILLPIVYGLIRGIWRGLVGELTAMVAILAGILCAKYFAQDLAEVLLETFAWSKEIMLLVCYATIFISVTLVLHLIGKLISKLLKTISLGWLNHLLGAVFGAFKWALIVSVLINCFDLLDNKFHILQPNVKEQAWSYEPIKSIATTTWEVIQDYD